MPNQYTASVKIMRSFDYSHFEICLGTTEPIDLAAVDAMRKEAARLADKAVEQYKIANENAEKKSGLENKWELEHALEKEEENRTPKQKAIVKFFNDAAFRARHSYDYEDDWNEPDYGDED